MQFGIIGSGSWATALTKILTDNGHVVHWCVRSENIVQHLEQRHHNPNYLSSVYFNISLLRLTTDAGQLIEACDHIIIAVPSAYVKDSLNTRDKKALAGKKIISAVKGILPDDNLLLNEYLASQF